MNKYEELKEEMQKLMFTCHFCRYARDNGSHEDGWKCTNPKWDSNFIKNGRDFCSDFKGIEINIPQEYLSFWRVPNGK